MKKLPSRPCLLAALLLTACGSMSTRLEGPPVTGIYSLEVTALEDTCNGSPYEAEMQGVVIAQEEGCNLGYSLVGVWGPGAGAYARENFLCEEGYSSERTLGFGCEAGVATLRLAIVAVSPRRVDLLVVTEMVGMSGCAGPLGDALEGTCRSEYLFSYELDTPCEAPCEIGPREGVEWEDPTPYECSCPDAP